MNARSEVTVTAVLFDLDDTLFPQAQWLHGAFAAVAATAAGLGVADATALEESLLRVAARGSASGRVIDRALEAVGSSVEFVPPLVETFLAHRPARLDPFPGVGAALDRLARTVPLGLVTDGNPAVQRAKLAALGLKDAFCVVVCSDELGRSHRKPDPAPFLQALAALGAAAPSTVFVGDHPRKDVAGALGVGMRAVRVRTGEYATEPNVMTPLFDVVDAAEASRLIDPLLAPRSSPEMSGATDRAVPT